MTATPVLEKPRYSIKTPTNLSPRIQWLRDYYFQGVKRAWNNEYTSWTTGEPWDFQYNELTFYIVPETYAFLQTFRSSFSQIARPVELHPDFWKWSLPERRAWFNREVMVQYLPKEVLPGDLIAGARFNIQTSSCLTEKETQRPRQAGLRSQGRPRRHALVPQPRLRQRRRHLRSPDPRLRAHPPRGLESRARRTGVRSTPDCPRPIKAGKRGGQLRAMLTAATMPRDLAAEYSKECTRLAEQEADPARKQELLQMADNLTRVPWEPAQNFWEAVQSLWLTHMLVMADENYPGPGVSFGRLDQYLYPMWEKSIREGMDPEFGKEILKCFWIHCNTAYDGMIRTGGNQGITAGYGQLFTIGGMGAGGRDMTNDLTYILLDVIDEMSPILEPKPNVRLHRGSPDQLLDRVVEMIASSQGSPFLLNFDERSMAGMMLRSQAFRRPAPHP